jgi:uncharacterized protein YggE
MKNHLKQLLAIAVLACLPTPAFSQTQMRPPLITVLGSAEVKVAPDEIYLRIGVETRNESLEIAKRENDEHVSKSLAFLKNNGVNEKDVQTDFISIQPDYDNSLRTKVLYYTVRKSIEIKLNKIKVFEGILTGLLTNGVNAVHGIEFRTTELRKHRDEARAMAIRAATEKADALASELKVKRGKVYSVNANEYGGWWNSGSYWGGSYGGAMYQNSVRNAGGASEEEGTLAVGQISVSASVDVSFLIE